MATAQITAPAGADFAAEAARLGLTLRNITEFDMLPHSGLILVHEMLDQVGSTEVEDTFVYDDVHRDSAAAAITFNGDYGAWANNTSAKLTTALASMPSFELTLLMRLEASGQIFGPFVSGVSGNGAQLTGSITNFSNNGSINLTAYDVSNVNGTTNLGGSGSLPITNSWRIVSAAVDAATRTVKLTSDMEDKAAVLVSGAGSLAAGSGNHVLGSQSTASFGGKVALITLHNRYLTQAERNLNLKFFRDFAAAKSITLGT